MAWSDEVEEQKKKEAEEAEQAEKKKPAGGRESLWGHGCQMAKFDPFLSLDCAWVEGGGAIHMLFKSTFLMGKIGKGRTISCINSLLQWFAS